MTVSQICFNLFLFLSLDICVWNADNMLLWQDLKSTIRNIEQYNPSNLSHGYPQEREPPNFANNTGLFMLLKQNFLI